jgi:hydroxyacylglutathione hydrolase
MSQETSSTIGQQRQFNYALKPMPQDEFVKMMTTDLPEVPAYFPQDVEIKRTGAAELEALPRPAALTPADVQQVAQAGATVLDVRASAAFGNGHIPGALNIGLGGQFASWAGTLLTLGTTLVLVADDHDQVDEAVTRLARVGIETVNGYLDGGMYAWDQAGLPVACIAQMPVDELQHQLEEHADLQIIDVRRPAEFATGRVPGAINAQLAHLEDELAQFDPQRPTAVICAGGYRSTAATSVLARHGFTRLFNIVGGTSAWINAGYEVEGDASATCQRSG